MASEKPTPQLRDYSWMIFIIVPAFILFVIVFGPVAEKREARKDSTPTPTVVVTPTVTGTVPSLPPIDDAVNDQYVCTVISVDADIVINVTCEKRS